MAREIERKFRVVDDRWREVAGAGRRIRQAYLVSMPALTIRVRVEDDARATLTLKSGGATLSRDEFEYAIPLDDAGRLIALRDGAIIEKVRYEVASGDLKWEIDVFEGENAGLVIAEIELDHEARCFDRPPWVGEEITANERFYNASLARRPYGSW